MVGVPSHHRRENRDSLGSLRSTKRVGSPVPCRSHQVRRPTKYPMSVRPLTYLVREPSSHGPRTGLRQSRPKHDCDSGHVGQDQSRLVRVLGRGRPVRPILVRTEIKEDLPDRILRRQWRRWWFPLSTGTLVPERSSTVDEPLPATFPHWTHPTSPRCTKEPLNIPDE